jgi:hypothetical protein
MSAPGTTHFDEVTTQGIRLQVHRHSARLIFDESERGEDIERRRISVGAPEVHLQSLRCRMMPLD